MIRIGVSGALGKMGKRVINLAKNEGDLELVFGLEKKGHPKIGDIFEGVKIVEDPKEIEKCDCLIEFSTPEATLEHLPYLVKFKKSAVIGTTGFSQEEIEKIKEASKKIGIVFSPNMSISVNLFFKLIKEAAKILKGYKVYICLLYTSDAADE